MKSFGAAVQRQIYKHGHTSREHEDAAEEGEKPGSMSPLTLSDPGRGGLFLLSL